VALPIANLHAFTKSPDRRVENPTLMDAEPRLLDDRRPSEERLWRQILGVAAGANIVCPSDAGGDVSFWGLYHPVAAAGGASPFVIGQLGQSLDGRIATATGQSRYINGPEAIRHLHRLRALVDAVIVGIDTVVADDPRLTVRHAPGGESNGSGPARVVIDPNFRLPPDARILADDGVPVFAVQSRHGARPASVTPIVIAAVDGKIPPAAIIRAVAALGYRRILVEGGSRTLSMFLAAGALDRLHLCIAPMVIGSGPIGITLPPIDLLDAAVRPRTVVHHLGGDVLFDCALDSVPADPGTMLVSTIA